MDDLISRQAAIDYFVINVGFHDEDGYPIEDTDELRKIWTEYFDGIPSAEPKRGKWNRLDMDTFNCNKCGATFVLNQGGEKMHFCPNCMADMRGEQNETD